jgi:hypothetical protein
VCGCDWNFLCSRCRDTPADPMYLLDEPDPVDPLAENILLDEIAEWIAR